MTRIRVGGAAALGARSAWAAAHSARIASLCWNHGSVHGTARGHGPCGTAGAGGPRDSRCRASAVRA